MANGRKVAPSRSGGVSPKAGAAKAKSKANQSETHKRRLMTSAKGVHSACYHPDGKSVLVTNDTTSDMNASIWATEAIPAASTRKDETPSVVLRRESSVFRESVSSARAAANEPEVTFAGVHTAPIYWACFSADGTLVATCGRDNLAVVWNARSGEPISKMEGHTNIVRHVAFSPDGKRLATASFDKTVGVWSTEGDCARVGKPQPPSAAGAAPEPAEEPPVAEQLMLIEGHTSDVYSAEFSHDGTMIVTASADCTAAVWDVSGAQPCEVATLRGHLSIVRSAQFDRSGERVITASSDGSAAVWCIATAQRSVVMIPPTGGRYATKPAGLHHAAFSPHDDHCITCAEDGLVRVWRLSESTSAAFCVAALTGAKSQPAAVCTHAQLSPDGRSVVGSFADGRVYQWFASVREERRRMLTGHSDRIWGAKLSPDGATVYSASSDQTVGVFDVASGVRLKTLDGVHTNTIRAISVSRCGRYVCTGCPDKKVGVWDAAEDYRLCAEFVHTHGICAVSAAKDKAERPRILFASSDKRANVVDVWAGKADEADGVYRSGAIVATFEGHTENCAAVDWSECCRRIVTGGDDYQAFVFDVATESIVTALVGHTSYVCCCAFGPGEARDSEGKLVPSRCITGSNDRTAVVWDAVSGAQLRVFAGHAHAIWGVAFAPGGKQIATASQDATVALWSVDSDAKLFALSGHAGTVFDVDFSSDGETLITAGRDAAIGVWLLSLPFHTSDIVAALREEDDAEGTTTRWLLQSSSLNNTWAMDEVDGGSAVHSLAACYSDAWPSPIRYEQVVEAWFAAGRSAPYYPLTNDEGVTPLELAIERANRHFIAGLFRAKALLHSGGDDGGGSGAARRALRRSRTGVEVERFDASRLTDRDLKALVNFWPALAVEFFVESDLLATAPKHIAQGCNAFVFTRDFEVIGSEHGPSEPAGLWVRYAATLGVRARRCLCRGGGHHAAEQVQAQIFAVPGMTDAPNSYGHDALRGFANGGNQMLDAFDTDAMRVLTEFRWRTFGQIGYAIRFSLFLVYLALHSLFVAQIRDFDRDALLSADADAKAVARAMLSVGCALIAGAVAWLLSEMAKISNLGANWKEYFRDLYNWNDCVSSFVTIAMVICIFAEVDQGAASSMASLASLLAWLRLFEIVRGVPGLGFYPFLVIEAVTDMKPFLFVLFVTATAFSVSMMPLAKETMIAEGGEAKENPFYRLDTAVYRTFLMTLGDWDSDEIKSSENAYTSQGLFAIFLVFVPIVMLSMLISILGDTFDRVTEQQSRVVAKQRMQVTMHVEAEIYALTCCCRKRFDAWARPRWYPRWLHVLRRKTHDGGANWKGRMQKLYSKIELHGLEAVDGVDDLAKSVTHQLKEANKMNQLRHDELSRDLGIRIKAIDDYLRRNEGRKMWSSVLGRSSAASVVRD